MKKLLCLEKRGPWAGKNITHNTETNYNPKVDLEIPNFVLEAQEQRYMDKKSKERLYKKNKYVKKKRRAEIRANAWEIVKLVLGMLLALVGIWAWLVLTIGLLG